MSGKKESELTMAQELQAILNSAGKSGATMRHELCQRAVSNALLGNMRALAWVFEVSGEGGREQARHNSNALDLENLFG